MGRGGRVGTKRKMFSKDLGGARNFFANFFRLFLLFFFLEIGNLKPFRWPYSSYFLLAGGTKNNQKFGGAQKIHAFFIRMVIFSSEAQYF